MYRYLAIIWNPQSPEATRLSELLSTAFKSKHAEWHATYDDPGALVMQTGLREDPSKALLLKRNSGVILGSLFNRHNGGHVTSIGEEETQKILASGGQLLIDHYWGSYIAVIHDKATSKHHVIREPTRNLPCYHTNYKSLYVFFSHIEDCILLLPAPFSINRRYLTRWLVFSRLTSHDSGLENVEDMQGGERLTVSDGKSSRSLLWNPVEIARTALLEPPDEAAKQLRSTVQQTISAWASCYQKITLKLSGGLDSSIVAGCLAQSPSSPEITYLNFSIDEVSGEHLYLRGVDRRLADKLKAIAGNGDERHFARLVAELWNTPLIERKRTTSMDLMRLWHAPLTVNPSEYFTSIEADDAETEMVKASGTLAFFSGLAGDSVLLATMQPLPAIDYAYLHGIKFGLWSHLVATSTLSRDSLWTVLGKAIRHGALGRPYRSPLSVLQQPTLLREELMKRLTRDDFESHWARVALPLPPGKQIHVNGLAGSAHYDCVFHSGKYADHIDPLNSQPIWEFMLQLPTYTILTGGISRGLARRAFADLLPPEIRKRQVKGSGTTFYQQVVRKNRDFLRETLLDGLLVQEDYLDRKKLREYLATDEPFRTVGASQILSYLAAEVWLRRWTAIRETTTASQDSLRTIC